MYIYLIHAAKKDLKSQLRVTKLLWLANIVYCCIAVWNIGVGLIQKYPVK